MRLIVLHGKQVRKGCWFWIPWKREKTRLERVVPWKLIRSKIMKLDTSEYESFGILVIFHGKEVTHRKMNVSVNYKNLWVVRLNSIYC